MSLLFALIKLSEGTFHDFQMTNIMLIIVIKFNATSVCTESFFHKPSYA